MVEEFQNTPAGWKQVSFTRATWRHFKTEYKRACSAQLKEFIFNGETYDTNFTKYFIEANDRKFL